MEITEFHKIMKDQAKLLQLPLINQSDLDADLLILNKFGKTRYVWGLRDAGTVLFPLNVGVDSHYFNHYAYSSDKLFLADVSKQKLLEITPDKMIQLGSELPLARDIWSDDLENFESQVNGVLDMRHWGVFYPPEMQTVHWNLWFDYFKSNQNNLMTDFMSRAINHRRSLLNYSKVA